ncbi:MAG: metallopeptidase family protein [Desulfomonile tiedjei]|uniref:Metallopeptidase family protein n=1 Tax=Desulfomonile tiedjei TaxID=2358 RepID=A0A9D6V569_9BACT|nr:metallopeptidase family protein [Desulfomonile tiedjei]
MENVEVIVEDFPDEETMASLGITSKWGLLGLYVGVPITHQSVFSMNVLPERIYLYRRPIVRVAGSPHYVVETVRDVLLHEIGHHFGFDDEELEHMTEDEE